MCGSMREEYGPVVSWNWTRRCFIGGFSVFGGLRSSSRASFVYGIFSEIKNAEAEQQAETRYHRIRLLLKMKETTLYEERVCEGRQK